MKTTTAILVTIMSFAANAQDKQADTVIVPLAKTSKIIFTIEDRSDLDILRHYNFQDLFEDILQRIEESDTLKIDSTESKIIAEEDWNTSSEENDDNDNDDDDDEFKWEIGQTWQSSNVDFLKMSRSDVGRNRWDVRWLRWDIGEGPGVS